MPFFDRALAELNVVTPNLADRPDVYFPAAGVLGIWQVS
jgi:hypothetical protein